MLLGSDFHVFKLPYFLKALHAIQYGCNLSD